MKMKSKVLRRQYIFLIRDSSSSLRNVWLLRVRSARKRERSAQCADITSSPLESGLWLHYPKNASVIAFSTCVLLEALLLGNFRPLR
jgi:hypothetical protein